MLTDASLVSRPLRLAGVLFGLGFGMWTPGEAWPRLILTVGLGFVMARGLLSLLSIPRAAALAGAWVVPY